jgi:hypothetical protein
LAEAHAAAVGGGVEVGGVVGCEVPLPIVESEGAGADGLGRTLVKTAVADVSAADVVVREVLQAFRCESRSAAVQNVVAVRNPLAPYKVEGSVFRVIDDDAIVLLNADVLSCQGMMSAGSETHCQHEHLCKDSYFFYRKDIVHHLYLQ